MNTLNRDEKDGWKQTLFSHITHCEQCWEEALEKAVVDDR